MANLTQAMAKQYNAMINQALQQGMFTTSTPTTWISPTGSSTTIGTWFNSANVTTPVNGPATVTLSGLAHGLIASPSDRTQLGGGFKQTVDLPDGTVIEIEADDSYQIIDKDAKVIYRAAAKRDFNPFINASDKLEDFIRFCGQNGVKQHEVLDLPLNLFIGWLVIEAAKADREPTPDIPLLPDLRKRIEARCVSCGRFIRKAAKAKKIEFCNSVCFERRLQCL